MTKPKTHVIILLDKSGSMQRVSSEAVNDFNETIQEYKTEIEENGHDIVVSLITFNNNVYEHAWMVDPREIQEASVDEYVANGGTAFFDALGYATQKMYDNFDKDTAYLFKLITDGRTNRDKNFDREAIAEIVEGCKGTNNITFTMMGCNQNYMENLCRQIGVSTSNVAVWSTSSQKDAMLASSLEKSRSKKYFASRASGQSHVNNYMSDSESIADFTQTSNNQPEVLDSVVSEQSILKTFDHKEVEPAPVPTLPVEYGKEDVRSLKEIMSERPKYSNEVISSEGNIFDKYTKVIYHD